MLTRIFGVALGAGCAAGLALALLQAMFTTPLILQAEVFETASHAQPLVQHAVAGEDEARLWLAHSGAAHDEDGGHGFLDSIFGDWAPEDGLERTAYTALSSVLVGFGYALMLLSVMLLGAKKLDASSGLLWGIGGFAAVSLAPALGLPPELPGSAAADLLARQTWWLGTAAATGLGLWLIASRENAGLKVSGLLLLIAPHLIGAPHPHEYASRVPAELQGHFVAASLVLSAVFWALLGSLTGWLWQRGEGR
ncbi:CbtA family protein [Stappia sp. F7233]|uniref:CbtA family protein n=1 Tax=Stappia albiluteola TaxID=2758565 RepID=A0A839ABD3_9HYPH|nr:CbtA family protein [Stappia albiluteola]MBA5776445.1 CbtA family protein [Stappia albiluteola]